MGVLVIYDALGRRIRTLVDGEVRSGEGKVIWDGRDHNNQLVASGVYFYRLIADGGWTDTGKAVLLR